jgi:hypothetical protein
MNRCARCFNPRWLHDRDMAHYWQIYGVCGQFYAFEVIEGSSRDNERTT